jgi:hypothetical protein
MTTFKIVISYFILFLNSNSYLDTLNIAVGIPYLCVKSQ